MQAGAQLIYCRALPGSEAQRDPERNRFEVAYSSEQLVRPIGKRAEWGREDKRKRIASKLWL